ncbi:MAG: P-II family nitrogen regulator [Gaiellales bacterium]|nr:MAG: P-II family nitrogen regulator [Gaiellales bacterium]
MEMVRAIIRPNLADKVVCALEEAGFVSMTRSNVYGRGKQKGIKVGDVQYDELPKTMLMLVVNERDTQRLIDTLMKSAGTGNLGDGKIFISPVDAIYTIRTGESGL